MKSKAEEIEQLREIFRTIREQAERDGYIDGIFSDDLLCEMIEDIKDDICYSSYAHMRRAKMEREAQVEAVSAELQKKREEIYKLNTQVHDLNQRLFNVRDSIRRLAFDAEKK